MSWHKALAQKLAAEYDGTVKLLGLDDYPFESSLNVKWGERGHYYFLLKNNNDEDNVQNKMMLDIFGKAYGGVKAIDKASLNIENPPLKEGVVHLYRAWKCLGVVVCLKCGITSPAKTRKTAVQDVSCKCDATKDYVTCTTKAYSYVFIAGDLLIGICVVNWMHEHAINTHGRLRASKLEMSMMLELAASNKKSTTAELHGLLLSSGQVLMENELWINPHKVAVYRRRACKLEYNDNLSKLYEHMRHVCKHFSLDFGGSMYDGTHIVKTEFSLVYMTEHMFAFFQETVGTSFSFDVTFAASNDQYTGFSLVHMPSIKRSVPVLMTMTKRLNAEALSAHFKLLAALCLKACGQGSQEAYNHFRTAFRFSMDWDPAQIKACLEVFRGFANTHYKDYYREQHSYSVIKGCLFHFFRNAADAYKTAYGRKAVSASSSRARVINNRTGPASETKQTGNELVKLNNEHAFIGALRVMANCKQIGVFEQQCLRVTLDFPLLRNWLQVYIVVHPQWRHMLSCVYMDEFGKSLWSSLDSTTNSNESWHSELYRSIKKNGSVIDCMLAIDTITASLKSRIQAVQCGKRVGYTRKRKQNDDYIAAQSAKRPKRDPYINQVATVLSTASFDSLADDDQVVLVAEKVNVPLKCSLDRSKRLRPYIKCFVKDPLERHRFAPAPEDGAFDPTKMFMSAICISLVMQFMWTNVLCKRKALHTLYTGDLTLFTACFGNQQDHQSCSCADNISFPLSLMLHQGCHWTMVRFEMKKKGKWRTLVVMEADSLNRKPDDLDASSKISSEISALPDVVCVLPLHIQRFVRAVCCLHDCVIKYSKVYCSKQPDGYNCGVFAALNCLCFELYGNPMPYSQKQTVFKLNNARQILLEAAQYTSGQKSCQTRKNDVAKSLRDMATKAELEHYDCLDDVHYCVACDRFGSFGMVSCKVCKKWMCDLCGSSVECTICEKRQLGQ